MTKIMILEDSMDSLMALTAMIKKISKDIAVVPVESLEKARAALQDEANLFQAFLLDINLDEQDMEDASGMEFARQVRNDVRYAFTPLVMITSIANLELPAYRELHCYQYILKPGPLDQKQFFRRFSNQQFLHPAPPRLHRNHSTSASSVSRLCLRNS